MRKLLYVPIIHMESDLGSAASAIDTKSASLCGEEKWTKHKETVAKFWENMADYFATVDTSNLKIYQDGLPAEGQLGIRIVEEGAKRGSKNHQIILDLMRRGAKLMKTEDPFLLKEEYKSITRLVQSKSAAERTIAYAKYKLRKGQLTKARDKFVAKTIDETLKQGETAVLFIGAYHNVHLYLPRDITVEYLKEHERVKAYFVELVSGGKGRRFQELARYLACPVADIAEPGRDRARQSTQEHGNTGYLD